MKGWYRIAATVAAILLLAVAPALAQEAVPDFTQFGFPQVAASQDVAAGAAATVTASVTGGTVTVQIPAGTFANATRFEILTGPLSNFTAQAPQGTNPVLDFAFRVTDLTTGQLVGSFSPVMTTATSTQITAASDFFDISTTGEFTEDRDGLQVQAGTLSIPLDDATEGWVVTDITPAAALPVTGRQGWDTASRSLLAGALLLLALGGLALFSRRRVSL